MIRSARGSIKAGRTDGDLGPLAGRLDRRFSGTVLLRSDGRRAVASQGLADREHGVANGPQTRFNTASLTKLFTAVAVLRLVSAGSLRLSDTIADVLPTANLPAASEMEILHLLTHSAGFPEEGPDVPGGAHRDWLTMARVGLEYPPGRGWGYSNVGYAVLGACIEQRTGRPFYEAMHELVFGPAHMAATDFDDPDASSPPRAVSYTLGDRYGGARGRLHLDRGGPYGYAYSTVGDLEHLIDLVHGASIVDRAQADAILHGSVATSVPDRRSGFGMFNERVRGVELATLSGAGPGISAWLDFAPSRGYLAIALSNLPKPTAHRVGESLRAAFLR